MPLPIICGGLSFLGLAILWIALRDQKIDRDPCPLPHRFGPIRLQHYAAIECAQAILVASWAGGLWELLREEFPAETEEGFFLDLTLEPSRGPGFKAWGQPRAVVNLWGINFNITHPGYPESTRKLRGVIAEELHHLVRARRCDDAEYAFTFDRETRDRELETLFYYALNPHETEALRFVVRATGERAELLERVEEYLANK